jgi:MFS family permease
MMNAGLVPVMSAISNEFADASPTLLKFNLSIAAIFSIIFSLLTGYLDRFLPKKKLLFVGLLMYAAGGMGTGLARSIGEMLAFRALLGAGAGTCLPLATGYIAEFYEGEERKQAIGFAFFAANLAAVVLPLVGGILAERNWRYAFVVYGIALVVLVFTMLFIPNREKEKVTGEFKLFYISRTVIFATLGYMFVTMLFLSLPSNISMFLEEEQYGTVSTVAYINSTSTFITMFVNLNFRRIYSAIKDKVFPLGLLLCGLGFATLSISQNLATVLLGKVMIGTTMGMLHPFWSYKVTQTTPREHATSALSLVNSGFRMGTFISPVFFLLADSALGIKAIRGEFLLVSVISILSMLAFSFLSQRVQARTPQEAG